jgi:tetratricopeptide (TPR) repeat protein/DNA-binding SARP family transcriptional activator
VVEIQVLGPVRLLAGGAPAPMGPKLAVFLAALVTERGKAMSSGRLVQLLWAEDLDQGRTHEATLRSHASHLRKRLALDRSEPEHRVELITRRAGGVSTYLLKIPHGRLDLDRFEDLIRSGGTASDRGEIHDAIDAYEAAHQLWRGDPFGELGQLTFLAGEVRRISELHVVATEGLLRARLDAGQHAEIIGQLMNVVAEHPTRVELRKLLVTALYRSGRVDEAATACRAGIQVLAGSGVDAPDLDNLLREVLRHTDTVAPRVHALPRGVSEFVDRETELGELSSMASGGSFHSGPVVCALDGMPGVGKTALAVRAARELADRFPDGQIYMRLHSHTPGQDPVDPFDALAALLLGTGTAGQYLPVDLDGRALMWRDRLAGRRILLVLDDAGSARQVEPLLPGADTCMVIVTSRRRIDDLRCEANLSLSPLPKGEARTLFAWIARRDVDALHRETLDELLELCSGLPLALTLLASRLRHHPKWNTPDLADLAEAMRRPQISDRQPALHAAFDLSYRGVSELAQSVFRTMSLHPGVDADLDAVAALAGLATDEARSRIDELFLSRLVDEPTYGRFRMHNLLRAYGRHLFDNRPADEREQCLRRLRDHYLRAVLRANRALARDGRQRSTSLVDEALTWLDQERENLLACADQAIVTASDDSWVIRFAEAIAAYLRRLGLIPFALHLHQHAATAARTTGDAEAEATALRHLAAACRVSGDHGAAVEALERSALLSDAAGDRVGQADALRELGLVQRLTGNVEAATETLSQALALQRSANSDLGMAEVLTELGATRFLNGDAAGAEEALTEALGRYRRLHDPLGEADALYYVGVLRRLAEDFGSALRTLESAKRLYQRTGDRVGEANALTDIGILQSLSGDIDPAFLTLSEALTVYREIGYRLGQANCYDEIGLILLRRAELPQAASMLSNALEIYRELDHPHGQAEASRDLARVQIASGDNAGARRSLTDAGALFDQVGQPDSAADARRMLDDLT